VLPKLCGRGRAKWLGFAVFGLDHDRGKLMRLDDTELDAGVLLDLALEVLREILVAFRRNDGEGVDLVAANAPSFFRPVAHNGQTKPATDGLPTLAFGAHVAQGANLEDVGVVPAFA
jgi:hypothetical protein